MAALRILIGLLFVATPLWAQPVLTLTDCQSAAGGNYPLQKQKDLARQTGDLTLANLNRHRPQLAVNGQATWQSEVTQVPIELPNLSIPTISKDQYKLTLDAAYTLFDGGLLPLQQQAQRVSTALEQQRVDVELNRLNDQVNALYLNALLTDENLRLTQLLGNDLDNRIQKAGATVKFGTAAPMTLDALRAERLRVNQRLNELTSSRRGLRESLALLTGLPITDATTLTVPIISSPAVDVLPLRRPELGVYTLQRSLVESQLRLADNRRQPRFSLFAQTGFGRPALNFLRNDLRGFFLGGLRLNWNLSALYTLRTDKAIIALGREQVDVQQATFEQNLRVQLRQQRTEIDRVQSLLADDQQLVDLRTKIRKSTAVQLDNGVIAARDYVTELNAENQAMLNLKLHELQLIQAQLQYRTLTGN